MRDLMMVNDGEYLLVGGIPTPLKNMKVSWDDEVPTEWEKIVFQTTNQFYYYHIWSHDQSPIILVTTNQFITRLYRFKFTTDISASFCINCSFMTSMDLNMTALFT